MKIIFILLCLFLVACAAPVKQEPARTLEEHISEIKEMPELRVTSATYYKSVMVTGSLSMPTVKIGDKMLLVRQYAFATDKKLESSFNTILFAKRPVTKEDFDRYYYICEQWKASFVSRSEITDKPKDTHLVPFYWLLNKPKKSEACNDLVNNYDYSRAQLLTRQFGLDDTKIFIVFSHENILVTMNLDVKLTHSDIELSMDTWKRSMSSIPKKSTALNIYNLVYSAKAVLGVIGTLITFKG